MRHQLEIITTFTDGHVSTYHYEQDGSAQDAHDALAKRWKAAGATFERDRANRVLRCTYERGAEHWNERESVTYTDEIRHEDIT